MSINIKFYNDMGHLLIENEKNIPQEIISWAHQKIKNKINYATDKNNLGCRFYILRAGLDSKWTYNFQGKTIILDFSQLDKFDSKTMYYI